MLLVAAGLWVWEPVQAGAQVFAISAVNNFSNLVGTPITIQLTVTNTTGANSQLTWGLNSNPASSATLSATNTGPVGPTTFSWTPTQAQVVIFTVSVSQFNTLNTAGTSFIVTVTNAGSNVGGVVIDPIPPQTVAEGVMLIFTNHAHATDNPTNALAFSLLNAPVGASFTNNSPTSGVFTWTPSPAQALNPYYTIREIVTETGTSASNYQDFQVAVTRTNDCAQIDAFLTAVQQGGYFLLSDCTTIVLSNTLTIAKSVTLDSGTNNVTITGNNLFRLFTVLPGVTNFTLSGITLSGGQDPNGGGLYVSPSATVVLTNCTLIGNRAVGANGVDGTDGSTSGINGGNGGNGTAGIAAFGGTIYNLGTLTALNCQFLTNSATGGSGGAGGGGGNGSGIGNSGSGGLGGNGAPGGGGAICSAGSLLLSNCTFAGNSVTGGSGGAGGTNGTGTGGVPGTGGAGMAGSGAAVYSANNAAILNCTFSGNVAQGGDSAAGGTDSAGNGISGAAGGNSLGGGVCSLNVGYLTNCTFCNNDVTGGNGGGGGNGRGIRHGGNGGNGGNGLGGGLFNAGSIFVVNCTFSGCGGVGGTNGLAGTGLTSGTDGAPGLGEGGDIAQGSGTFVLRNSILATSSAGGNAYDTSASRITDGGYNISSDASLNLTGTSLENTDALLGSLASNGGPTQTIALQTNSPALNRVPPNLSPLTDQRGVQRPQGTACDVGAYELVVPPIPAGATIGISLSPGTGVSINFPSQAGFNYVLEYKNALNDPAWTPLPAVAGTGGVMVLQDTNAPVASRYYRVLRQ